MDVEEGEAKMCRLCGQYERICIDVFGEEGMKRYLGLKIYNKINIMIKKDDNLPQQICLVCCNKLDFTCSFYDTCHIIQKRLCSIEKNKAKNDAEDKENTLSLSSNLRHQAKVSKSLRKKIHSIDVNSSIINDSSKNQNHENRLVRRDCLRDISSNAQSGTASWTPKQPVDYQRNKEESAQKGTASSLECLTVGEVIIKQEIKEECLPDSRSASFPPENSMVWIYSTNWNLSQREPDRLKDIMSVNNDPLFGDEAESNRNINPESNKPAVSDNIGESPTIVLNKSEGTDSLEPINKISSQSNENAATSGLSTGESEERCEQNKISELITSEQKQIIETYYMVDTDVKNKYAKEVGSNMIVRGKKDIKCNLCSAHYSRRDKCEVHIWKHFSIKPYRCNKCSFTTVTVSNIRCHIRKIHLKIKPFACKLCPKKYMTATLLKEHINTHTGERPYKCEMCAFSSTNRRSLKNHMGIHSNEDTRCNVCNKSFQSLIRMRIHMRIHNDNNVTCEICRVRLSNEKALETHHKKMHVHDYVCNVCSKILKSKKILRNHMNTHLEAKYKCTKCPNVYKSKHILNEHLLKHEGIRKYKCCICKKAFAQQSHLATHKKVHTLPSYECPGCNRKFNRRDNMKTHMTRCQLYQTL